MTSRASSRLHSHFLAHVRDGQLPHTLPRARLLLLLIVVLFSLSHFLLFPHLVLALDFALFHYHYSTQQSSAPSPTTRILIWVYQNGSSKAEMRRCSRGGRCTSNKAPYDHARLGANKTIGGLKQLWNTFLSTSKTREKTP